MELWSFGRYNLHLNDSEFWSLTAAQFSALCRRYGSDMERQDFRAAQICMLFANAYRDTKRHPQPFEITDFMLSKPQFDKEEPQSQDMLRKKLDFFMLGMGGDKRNGE